jgi:hypothetical protein
MRLDAKLSSLTHAREESIRKQGILCPLAGTFNKPCLKIEFKENNNNTKK